jgi:hypothetical protein
MKSFISPEAFRAWAAAFASLWLAKGPRYTLLTVPFPGTTSVLWKDGTPRAKSLSDSCLAASTVDTELTCTTTSAARRLTACRIKKNTTGRNPAIFLINALPKRLFSGNKSF